MEEEYANQWQWYLSDLEWIACEGSASRFGTFETNVQIYMQKCLQSLWEKGQMTDREEKMFCACVNTFELSKIEIADSYYLLSNATFKLLGELNLT